MNKFTVFIMFSLFQCLSCRSQSDSTITVKKGVSFSIRLYTQAGTGYSWELAGKSDGLVTQSKSQTYENAKDSRPGSPGIQTFYFKGKAAGTEKLEFVYQQPFVKPTPANAKKTIYTIKIE